MNKVKKFFKNSKSGVAAILAAVLTFTFVFGAMFLFDKKVSEASDDVEIVPTKIGFAGEVYSSTNKLKILEIVPDVALAEIAYMSGIDNSYTTSWETFKALPDTTFLDNLSTWVNAYEQYCNNGKARIQFNFSNDDEHWLSYTSGGCNSGYSAAQYKAAKIRYVDDNGNPYCYYISSNNAQGYEKVYTTNILAYAIFGEYHMCDKLEVVVATPDQLRNDDSNGAINNINNYKLYYFSKGNHNTSNWNSVLNNIMYNAVGTTGGYHSVTAGIDYSTDLLPAVAWKMAYDALKKEKAIMYESAIVNVGDNVNYTKYYQKLCALLSGVDSEYFVEHYMSTPSSFSTTEVYSGDLGSIDPKDFTLKYTADKDFWNNTREPETAITWNMQMFAYSGVYANAPDNHYNSIGNNNTRVSNNQYCYNSNNALCMSLLNSSTSFSNVNGGAGATHDELIFLFGDRNNNVLNAYIIQYILGLFTSYTESMSTLRVLEIEPANSFLYSSSSKSEILQDYLNKSTSVNLQVTQTTMNGFVAMTEDLVTNYDLVILGNKTYMSNASSNNYLTFANPTSVNELGYVSALSSKMQKLYLCNRLKNASSTTQVAFSGNDISMTALYKLLEYIDSGKPFAVSKYIYNETDPESKDENVYKLSKKSLEAGITGYTSLLDKGINTSNIIYIENNGTKCSGCTNTLKVKATPGISVYDGLKYQVNGDVVTSNPTSCVYSYNDGDGVAQTFVNFNVGNSLRIGKGKNSYKISIYLDSDGNGLITNTDNHPIDAVFRTDANGYVRYDASGNELSSSAFVIQLPAGMRGYVAWKIVARSVYSDDVTVLDGSNYAPAEITGAILNNFAAKKDVNVLQILPLSGNYEGNEKAGITLDLKTDTKFNQLFSAVTSIAGLNSYNIDAVTIDEFQGTVTDTTSPYYGDANGAYNKLNSDVYDILVFGFADSFNQKDITSDKALDAIEEYIKAGNAVLLSHDTLLYAAYSDNTQTNLKINNNDVSYKLTSRFRDTFGMDRYSISKTKQSDSLPRHGFSNLFVMRYASTDSNRAAVTGDTQYNMYRGMTGQIAVAGNFSGVTTTKAVNVNSGQITDYPYKLNSTDTFAEVSLTATHSQWFQLDVEASGTNYSYADDDVVVWYALSGQGGTSYYDFAGNDAINNYYIYSKNNITYTGAGHSGSWTDQEYKLFVNTIIKALQSAGNSPTVKVTSAVSLDNTFTKYVQNVRSGDYTAGTGSSDIEFYVYDEDLGLASTSYLGNGGIVYWDIDGDGTYNKNVDKLIADSYVTNTTSSLSTHQWGTVYSNDHFKVNLKAIGEMTDNDGKKLSEYLEQEQLRIGIVVYDVGRKKGSASIQCVFTDVFPLD